MASKTKMRCATCGKWFQSANAKDTTCPECTQKARKEKLAAKAAPQVQAKTVQHTAPPPPPKPKQEKSGTNQWLDSLSDVKVAALDTPARPKIPFSPAPREPRREPGDIAGENSHEEQGPPANYRERDFSSRTPNSYRDNNPRSNSPYRVGGGSGLPDAGPRPRQPMEGGRGPRPDRPPRPAGQSAPKVSKPKVKTPKPPPPPKPKHEKIEPPQPFEPTPEQVTQVETRYLELSTPVEFDGIRTQIAHELDIPKTAVKKIVKDLRDRLQMPSWWDAQTFKGSEEELAKIRDLYQPHLPLPDIGIHKEFAEQLTLKSGDVYQAIKTIRAQMGLPQYNDPALHGIELKPRKSAKAKAEETGNAEATAKETGVVEASANTEATTNTEAPVGASTTSEAKTDPTSVEATNVALVPTDTVADTDTGAVVEKVEEAHTTEEAP